MGMVWFCLALVFPVGTGLEIATVLVAYAPEILSMQPQCICQHFCNCINLLLCKMFTACSDLGHIVTEHIFAPETPNTALGII